MKLSYILFIFVCFTAAFAAEDLYVSDSDSGEALATVIRIVASRTPSPVLQESLSTKSTSASLDSLPSIMTSKSILKSNTELRTVNKKTVTFNDVETDFFQKYPTSADCYEETFKFSQQISKKKHTPKAIPATQKINTSVPVLNLVAFRKNAELVDRSLSPVIEEEHASNVSDSESDGEENAYIADGSRTRSAIVWSFMPSIQKPNVSVPFLDFAGLKLSSIVEEE